jgi:hypothetical protein
VSARSVIAGALVLVAAVAAFWFLALAPKRADVADIRDQVAQAEARRAAAESAAAAGASIRGAYQHDYATLARLGKAAPPDDDVASLVYQLQTLAAAHKVDFRAVKLADAASTTSTPSSSGATSSAGGSDTTAKDATAEDSGATASPVAPAVAQAPPGAVVGSAGLVTLPFTFTFDGGYLPMQRMLGAIDRLATRTDGAISVRGRLLTIDGFSLAASRFGFPKVKAVVSATAYIVPAAEGITGGATPQGPAGSTTSPGGG